MKRFFLGGPSLTRTFALLSLITIAFITAAQVTVQWVLLREDILERETTHTAEFILAEAYGTLRPEDFKNWRSSGAKKRFELFFRRSLLSPEILRVKVFDGDMRVIWSDEPRLLGHRFPDNSGLARALEGKTVAHLETVSKTENRYEKDFPQIIELYVPIAFSNRITPGTAAVSGVVEIYKNPARVLSNIYRGGLWIMLTSLGGAIVLYAALFGIVRRASLQLRTQRDILESQTKDLTFANQELRDTQEQLRSAERMATLGEVSAAVAHGIRNPLANIRASAQVAMVPTADSAIVRKALGTITSEVDRLARWLRALLDVVRPFEPRLAPVEINGVIEDLMALLDERITRNETRLTKCLAPGLPKLMADQVHLEQALLGVLENAIDASVPGGELRVETEHIGDKTSSAIRVTVRDSGKGIPDEIQAKLFEPFFTTKVKGTGLGLAIAQKVVTAHRGHIDIESQPQEGTAVTIVLPVNHLSGESA